MKIAINKDVDIDSLLEYYQNHNDDGLVRYIQRIVLKKSFAGEWDKGFDKKTQNLTTLLLYEYAESIESLTDGQIDVYEVIDKIANNVGRIRYGDFKEGADDKVKYDKMPVTSDEFKRKRRIDNHCGALTVEYKDSGYMQKDAICIFSSKQKEEFYGREYELSGIDLDDLSDVRATIFHELTHVMEKCKVKASELKKEDIVFNNGDSYFINTNLSPDLSKREFDDYIKDVDRLSRSGEFVSYRGISTIEINDKKSPNKRIMHNQISEGATEYIARKVLETIGEKVKHPGRYKEQVDIVGDIFEKRGLADTVTTYLTEPYVLINELEEHRVYDQDSLHYMSDYLNLSPFKKKLNYFSIDNNGKVHPELISKISNGFRKIFNKKENKKALPEPDGKEGKVIDFAAERNKYINSLKVEEKQKRRDMQEKKIVNMKNAIKRDDIERDD